MRTQVDDAARVEQRQKDLLNRFNILTFINERGVDWAVETLELGRNWTPEKYIACYKGENT